LTRERKVFEEDNTSGRCRMGDIEPTATDLLCIYPSLPSFTDILGRVHICSFYIGNYSLLCLVKRIAFFWLHVALLYPLSVEKEC